MLYVSRRRLLLPDPFEDMFVSLVENLSEVGDFSNAVTAKQIFLSFMYDTLLDFEHISRQNKNNFGLSKLTVFAAASTS